MEVEGWLGLILDGRLLLLLKSRCRGCGVVDLLFLDQVGMQLYLLARWYRCPGIVS